MPAPVLITLSDSERKEFQRRCRSGKTEARMKERLSIVLLADEGLTNEEITQQMPVGAHKAARWRNRFAQDGLKGIEKNLPRGANHGGADSHQQALLRQKIIEKTTKELPEGATHWSTRTLAAELGTNSSMVARVWRQDALSLHIIRNST